MLFVALLKVRPGTTTTFLEAGARRAQWEYPEGIKPVAEYWLESDDPRIVAIVEAESAAAFSAIRRDWDDRFELRVFPAITAEEGIEMIQQSAASTQT